MTYILLKNNTIAGAGGGSTQDNKVSISSADDTNDYLENKLTHGTWISLTKQNTGAVENILIEATGADASNVIFTPTTNTDWNSSADPGNTDDALDQLAARVKTLETTVGPSPDASAVTYTPAANSNWNSSADPGDVDNALDQLASRVKSLETTPPDASVITYAPAVLANWNSSADPGDTDNALDQLADRVKDLESSGAAPVVAITALDTTPDYLQNKIAQGSRITITKQNPGGNENLLITANIQDASIITYTPSDNTDWNGSADPGDVDDALNQLADRLKTAETTFGPAPDASAITYTPLTNTDWNSSADPGNTDDALDQLAARVKTIESTTIDASVITYTPTTNADWSGGTDPGDLDNAVDQLASRLKTVETGGGGGGPTTLVGAKVYRGSTPQTITNSTSTILEWDNEYFDTNAFHDNGTNPSRLTIPSGKDGYYHVGFTVVIHNSTLITPNLIYASLSRDGTNGFSDLVSAYSSIVLANVGGEDVAAIWVLTGSSLVSMSAGDYFYLEVFNDDTSHDGDFADTNGKSEFWCYLAGT